MRHIDFFYFLGSGYAYLSVMRIKALAEKAGISVAWRPFNVRPLMQENNVALRTEKAKVKYLWRDIERRCATHGIAFVKPPIWTTDPDLLANRVAIVASQEGWIEPYTLMSFQAWYLEGLPLGTEESLAHILGQLGKQTSAVIERANSADTYAQLDDETAAARSFGVFGSPSFVVDGELFWGDDRLEEAVAWASGEHRLQVNGRA